MPTPLRGEPPPKTQSITTDQKTKRVPQEVCPGTSPAGGYRVISQQGEKKTQCRQSADAISWKDPRSLLLAQKDWSRYRQSPRGGGTAPTAWPKLFRWCYRLVRQNHTIAIASDFRVDGAKSPDIPQKEGALGSEIAARNRKSLATFHRTLKLQYSIAFSCLGNRCVLGSAMGIAIANRKNQCDFGALNFSVSVQEGPARRPCAVNPFPCGNFPGLPRFQRVSTTLSFFVVNFTLPAYAFTPSKHERFPPSPLAPLHSPVAGLASPVPRPFLARPRPLLARSSPGLARSSPGPAHHRFKQSSCQNGQKRNLLLLWK